MRRVHGKSARQFLEYLMTEKNRGEKLDDRYLVKPLFKAMQVLRTVCESSQPLTLKDITELAEIPKSTVYRYLHTLTAMDMIDYDPSSESFSPGLGLWWLMQSADPFSKLRKVGSKDRRALMQKFNETVNLGVLTGAEVLYLEIVESARSLRMQAEPGARDDVHSTALGKVLLAFRPRGQWEAVLPDKLVRHTEKTIVNRKDLFENLEEIRRGGIAIEYGENEEGATCIAAPILDSNGVSLAAISVSAPSSRITEGLIEKIAAELLKCCAKIESKFIRDIPRMEQ